MKKCDSIGVVVLLALVPAGGQNARAEEDGQSSKPVVDPAVPEWARLYTEGLRGWRDIIYYWLGRQDANGGFGMGCGEDVEMVVGWPGVMMAADDQRIFNALDRMVDGCWYGSFIQRGYQAQATDAEHGPEPTSYGTPILLYQQFGSPRLIERLMATASNVDYWTGITSKGDRHMRSTYFGSQQMYEWPFYDEDCPINARAWIPMMQLVLYNRDPYLMKYYLEWADAWAKHALGEEHGKPPGILPGQVAFPTGEVGGYTNNWWGAGAHEFSSLWYQTRLHEVLAIAYAITGEDRYIAPIREMMRFFSTYARPVVQAGEDLPPDRLPAKYQFPPGWRDGMASTEWARAVAVGHLGGWYYYLTSDTQFDAAFSKLLNRPVERGPFARIDMDIVRDGSRRARSMGEKYIAEVVPRLEHAGSLANYAAAWWQKHYGTMTFGPRCFHDGGKLASPVNWPWVDFPPPSVVWKDTGYDTGIFVLEDSPQRFRAELCNVTDQPREIGAQLFTLDEGTYALKLGQDVDEDGAFDSVLRTDRIAIERGSIVRFELLPRVTMLLELTRTPDSGPVPPWRPRPDLGLDPWDVMISKERPEKLEDVTFTVRVHNIGSQPAEGVAITLAGLLKGALQWSTTQTLDRIDAPAKLQPSFVDVKISPPSDLPADTIEVVLDPADQVDELYEGNNTARVALADMKSTQREKRFAQHEPARKMTLADVKPAGQSRYDVPYRTGIELDGRITSAEWDSVPVFDFIPHSKEAPLKKRSWMQIVYDQEAMYIALRCEEPDMGWLDTDLKRMEDIYYKDGFEIFVDPGAKVWRYWQFCFDTVPHKFQTLTRNQYAKKAAWDVAIHKSEKEWSAEVRLPFGSFDVPSPRAGDRWRMNVMRYTTTFRDPQKPDRKISERSHFSPQGPLHGHHTPELFGDLYFQPGSPSPGTPGEGRGGGLER
jgi:hypothetical protein